MRLIVRIATGGLVCALFFGLLGCGKKYPFDVQDSTPIEIVTDSNAFPSVVMVVLPQGKGICTGTFISPNAVLTAAHCTLESGTYRVVSGFGSFTTSVRENFGPGELDDPNDMSLLVFATNVAKRSRGQVTPIGEQVQLLERIRLVGFGCNDLEKRKGTGIKRTGLNQVASLDNYIGLLSPSLAMQSRRILGSYNYAGSCFGDSGGPMFRMAGNQLALVGISHAGGQDDEIIHSQYVDINRADNLEFIETMDQRYALGVFDVCNVEDALSGSDCESDPAALSIFTWLKALWNKFLWLISKLAVWK